jgi:hypothetical protein
VTSKDQASEARSGPLSKAVSEPLTVDQSFDLEVAQLLSRIAKKRYLTGSSEEEKEEFRSAIVAISEDMGIPIVDVVSAMLDGNPKADGLTSVIADLYPDRPDIAVAAYMNGTDGRIRSQALSAYSSKLSHRRDLKGLEAMYELLPASQDRANIATRYVNAVAKEQDLASALNLIRDLDLKEEQRISVMGLYPYIRNNRVTLPHDELEQFYRLAHEFGMEQSARAATSTSN